MDDQGLMILSLVAGFVVTLALFAFVYFRGLLLLNAFRKKDYDAGVFLKWIYNNRHFEKRATLVILLALILWFVLEGLAVSIATPMFFSFIFVALGLGALGDKKSLEKLTKNPTSVSRDRKILYLYLALTAIYFATVFSYTGEINVIAFTFWFLVFFQAPPVFIIASNFVIRPFLKSQS